MGPIRLTSSVMLATIGNRTVLIAVEASSVRSVDAA